MDHLSHTNDLAGSYLGYNTDFSVHIYRHVHLWTVRGLIPEFPTGSKVAEGVDTMQQGAATYCSPEWLSQQLEKMGSGDSNSILVLDCRTPNDFNSSHISGAIHVTLPTIMLRRLKNGTLPVASVIKCNEGKEKFNSLYKTGTLVLYDQDSNSTSANSTTIIGLLLKKLKEDGCRVRLLEGMRYFNQLIPNENT